MDAASFACWKLHRGAEEVGQSNIKVSRRGAPPLSAGAASSPHTFTLSLNCFITTMSLCLLINALSLSSGYYEQT